MLEIAAAEVTRHLHPYLHGEPVPKTRPFEEREPSYRALDDATLCRRLVLSAACLAERHLPVPVVVAHGLFVMVTVALVLVAALGVAGS